MVRLSRDDLSTIRERMRNASNNWIRVGMSTCGLAAGSREVYDALVAGVNERGLDVEVRKVGCVGMCYAEPLVEVQVEGAPRTMYGEINEWTAERLLDSHVTLKRVVHRLAVPEAEGIVISNHEPPAVMDDVEDTQYRIVLRNCGAINPDDIEHYIGNEGYVALCKSLFEMTPEEVIEEISASGLRGRGGAGYPTGLKWKLTRQYPGEEKFIICNGDEGDPGAYMDRSILEGDPHSVIEGMIIAGYAIGATEGILYIRAEYPLAIERVEQAIRQAKRSGLLGQNILGTDFSFDLEVRLGAGAFVCGEETALIQSIEGKRGTPIPRPPYPSERGLWNSPTAINNVETLANVAPIIERGAKWFAGIGTEQSKGTKVFALTGKVARSGLVEVPMGTPLRQVVVGIGGGSGSGKAIKAVQTGGPSGGMIPVEYFDTPISYEHLQELGSIMGSGGMIVMDEDDSMVDIAKFYLGFCVDESCGKCAPCRIGGKQMQAVLERIASGNGKRSDLDLLREISHTMQKGSLCGLGQTAPNPVLSSLKYFENEYLEAVERD
jgi:NADP-reducing hydrogenase subunit HndC